MTDQEKPEAVADEDLDAARGGLTRGGATGDSYANLEVSHARATSTAEKGDTQRFNTTAGGSPNV